MSFKEGVRRWALLLGAAGAVDWTGNLGVISIETEDGQTVYPTPAPSRWLDL